ncbi:hypothetical protein B296_00053715 [Ensete ventricosum]|uniref:Uncharacterized protein n=1 Tax=Ensete ventricosum TaxID=4639 RepID=A0A426Y6U9_ENSVE|nr:hypothetical protein B296_00053715 [Ensete ventricosum]
MPWLSCCIGSLKYSTTSLDPAQTMNRLPERSLVNFFSPRFPVNVLLYSLKNSSCFHMGVTDYIIDDDVVQQIYDVISLEWCKCLRRYNTATADVRGSYPVPAEAKLTPVTRSLGPRLVPRWEVALDDGEEDVVVTRIDDGVPEGDDGRHCSCRAVGRLGPCEVKPEEEEDEDGGRDGSHMP